MVLFTNPYYKGSPSDHFNGKRFFHPWPFKAPSFLDVIKWKYAHKAAPWPKKIEHAEIDFLTHNYLDGINVIFIGHSSFLIQAGDCNILIDPIYSKYAGPLKTKMLKRRSLPGIPFDKLPRIDVILLSHSHYDHLDKATLKKLTKRHSPLFIVPLGVDTLLKKLGINAPSIALDWHQSAFFRHLELTLTPAQHWSSRKGFDKNMTLWGSFIIKDNSKTLYFAGDTGYYQDMFKEIGSRYGPIDLAILPIGAYKPRWFMKSSHMDPHDAVLAHLDLSSKKSIAMHHRCFPLADEGPYDAQNDLNHALSTHGLSNQDFVTLYEGCHVNL